MTWRVKEFFSSNASSVKNRAGGNPSGPRDWEIESSYCVATRTKPCFAPPKTESGMGMVFNAPSPVTLE